MVNQHNRRYRGLRVYDYDSAAAYIRGGRSGVTRPLYHKNLAVSLRDNGQSIGVHFKNWGPDLVRYVPGGKAVISLPPTHNYVSTRETISMYANLVGLYQKQNKLYLRQDNDPITPSRQVKCPKCKGRQVIWYQCNGLPSRNKSRYRSTTIKAFNGQEIYVYECTCLNDNPQLNPENHRASIRCNFCSGIGYREFGLKYQPFEWSGPPIGIDLENGSIIQSTINKPGIYEAVKKGDVDDTSGSQ